MDGDLIKVLALTIGGFAIILTGAFFGLTALEKISVENICQTWTEGTGRNTKFVENYPWYFDCLVETESGWVSIDVLHQVETPNLVK